MRQTYNRAHSLKRAKKSLGFEIIFGSMLGFAVVCLFV